MTGDMKDQGSKLVYARGRIGYPGSKVFLSFVPFFLVLSLARHPGLSNLVNFCTWPMVLALLMLNSL